MKTKLLIAGLVFMAITTLVSAQNQGAGQRPMDGTGKGSAFVDANKNGICDNYENRKPNSTNTPEINNCRGCGRGQGNGRRQCSGQMCMRQGGGSRNNFVDANNNGICDFRESPAKK